VVELCRHDGRTRGGGGLPSPTVDPLRPRDLARGALG
jgi:hypothetical protein